jgi:hypothetical protein
MRAAAVAVAALRFRNEHGRLPATLEELVPEYLDHVPLDPWTGSPLVYAAGDDRATIYSVGENGLDDGGPQDDVESTSDDRSFRLLLPREEE